MKRASGSREPVRASSAALLDGCAVPGAADRSGSGTTRGGRERRSVAPLSVRLRDSICAARPVVGAGVWSGAEVGSARLRTSRMQRMVIVPRMARTAAAVRTVRGEVAWARGPASPSPRGTAARVPSMLTEAILETRCSGTWVCRGVLCSTLNTAACVPASAAVTTSTGRGAAAPSR